MSQPYSETVDVITGVSGYGVETTQSFDGITAINVGEGHLTLKAENRTIAVFSPKTWLYVRRRPVKSS